MKKLILLAATLAASPLSAGQVASPAQPAPAASPPPATIAAPPATAPRTAPAGPSVTTGAGAITPIPATSPTEIGAIIAREFPAYDKDRSGALTPGEFGDWMVKLKTIADPTVRADAPATRTWLGAAFMQADADRSQAVTLTELAGFLTPPRS